MENASPSQFAVGIIGGGVAAMSCALWLKQLGHVPYIIEQKAYLGGQLLNLNRINRWILGTPDKTSAELAELYGDHIQQEAIINYCASQIETITAPANGFQITINHQATTRTLAVKALVIASGVRVQTEAIFAHIPAHTALYQAGAISYYPTDHLEQIPRLSGKTVAVIGGGDNAHYTANDLANAGIKTYLLIRHCPKARRMIRKCVELQIEQQLIIERTETHVADLHDIQGQIHLHLSQANGQLDMIIVDKIFVRAGFVPNTDFLDGFDIFNGIKKQAGYLTIDAAKRTSIPWVYAIGDVANASYQSIANAIADGTIAAQDFSDRI
jgi:thioredoxin reductase (NADPH)